MKNNKQNIRTDKFIITSMQGITITKKENSDDNDAAKPELNFDDLDLDNIPWEGNNYPEEINTDDLL